MRLLGRLFRKIGINTILLVLLVIEVPALALYSKENAGRYRYQENYKIADTVEITQLSAEDERLEDYESYLTAENNYYLVTIQIDNYYSKDLQSTYLTIENQDGTPFYARRVDYYDDVDSGNNGYHTVIPAGASGKVGYLISMTRREAERTESITIKPQEGYQLGGETEGVTVDF